MPKWRYDEKSHKLFVSFEGRSANQIERIWIDDFKWRYNTDKREWENSATLKMLEIAKRICGEPVGFVFKDWLGNKTEFSVQRLGEKFSATSNNGDIVCKKCQRVYSLANQRCPFCGFDLQKSLREYYYERFGTISDQIIKRHRSIFKERYMEYGWTPYYDICPYEELLEAEKRFELVRERDLTIKRFPPMFITVGGYSVEGIKSMSKDEFGRVFWESLEYERILKDVVSKMLLSADVLFENLYHSHVVQQSEEKERRECERKQAIIEEKSKQLKPGEAVCWECFSIFSGKGLYCYDCRVHRELSHDLKKLDVNSGGFFKNAPLLAPSMRPVGVTDEDSRRWHEHMLRIEIREWLRSDVSEESKEHISQTGGPDALINKLVKQDCSNRLSDIKNRLANTTDTIEKNKLLQDATVLRFIISGNIHNRFLEIIMTNTYRRAKVLSQHNKISISESFKKVQIQDKGKKVADHCSIRATIVSSGKATTINVNLRLRPQQQALIGLKVGDVFTLPGIDLEYKIEEII